MDYRHEIQFCYFLSLDASDYLEVLQRARVCDAVGDGPDRHSGALLLGLPEPPGKQIEQFMAEVAPRIRENVKAGRS